MTDKMERKCETVEQLIEYNEGKLELLREWQTTVAKAKELAEQNRFEESDQLDDRCIEIEDIFEEEYGIRFDSYGDTY